MILQIVNRFLHKVPLTSAPLLLALSGGPDSLALLHALQQSRLLECNKKNISQLHVAHVDHGWRGESAAEAAQLKNLVEGLGLTFHTTRLPSEPAALGNREERARDQRLAFFREVYGAIGCQALLLGHHADDQAETVLKRALEGATLAKLYGLREVREVHGMTLWRPLLTLSKKEISRWLVEMSLEGFDDVTNRDPRYLRTRLRHDILPGLSDAFGKNVATSLCRVGEESREISDYLDARTEPFMGCGWIGAFGYVLDLSDGLPEHHVELRHLVRRVMEREGLTLSRSVLEQIVGHLFSGAANKSYACGGSILQVDRSRLFICGPELQEELPSEPLSLIVGERYRFGPWIVSLDVGSVSDECCVGWRAVWKGECCLRVPEGELSLRVGSNRVCYPRSSSIDKWWTAHKVPAFLRGCVPLVWDEESVVGEFLSGKGVDLCSNRGGITLRLIGIYEKSDRGSPPLLGGESQSQGGVR